MLVYLNDRFVPAENAWVSVQDRGFRFGDGVFETIAVRDGALRQWAFHLERLNEGLAALRITADTEKLSGICAELIARNAASEGLLRIIISRGVGSLGYLPLPNIAPTLAIETLSKPTLSPHPLALWHSGMQKISPQALPVQYKLAQGLQSALAKMEAQDHGCFDSLLLNAQGCLAETAAANLFWLKRGVLYTPSLACGALKGATRHAVLQRSPWWVKEGAYRLSVLRGAEAVLLTNVAHGVLPVAGLKPHGWGWRSAEAAARLNEAITGI